MPGSAGRIGRCPGISRGFASGRHFGDRRRGSQAQRPDRLEIELAAAGSAELSSDALVKYRDAVQKTREAFDSLGLANLKLESRGLGIESASNAQNRAMMQAGMATNAGLKASTDITGSLRLVLTEIDQLSEQELTDLVSKLVDTARDSGATIGGGSGTAALMARIYGQQISQAMVTFVVANPEQARDEAYHKAFGQARAGPSGWRRWPACGWARCSRSTRRRPNRPWPRARGRPG